MLALAGGFSGLLVCGSGGLACVTLIFLINVGESSFAVLRPTWTRPRQCVFAAKRTSCAGFHQFARGCRLCDGVGGRVGGPVLPPWPFVLAAPRYSCNISVLVSEKKEREGSLLEVEDYLFDAFGDYYYVGGFGLGRGLPLVQHGYDFDVAVFDGSLARFPVFGSWVDAVVFQQ